MMARNKYNEASMFNMLTGIDRAIKSEAYKKYDLPTFRKGGKTGEEPSTKGAKKKAYQDAVAANVYDYLKRTNYKTPHVPGKTIDNLGRQMNCIHGVCQIVEGIGAKKFSQEYFGNMVFDDNMKKEGFYYAQPETEGFEIGDFLRFARTKGNANIMGRYSGSITPLNEDDLIPQHTSFILDKYKDDNGVTMYSIANNHGEEVVETDEVSEEELLQWAQNGKGSFNKMLIARYDPDKVAEDAEKSEKINKTLSGENSYAGKYSGRKPGVMLKEKDELGEELLGYYKKNYEKLGKSSDLPPEVLDKLFVKQIGIAKQESTTGGRSIGKSMVPEPMLPYARKIADALFDNDNWILDYWNKNADDVKSKFRSIKDFTDYITKDLKLDKEAREYLRYNSPASKGMFQQKELSQRGRFHKSGFDTPEDQFISSMDLAIDNYHKVKDKYPDMFEPELVELTTLMHNSPFKALTPEYVNYYLKNQDIDYVNKVNKYIPAYDIDKPIEKETELQKFIQNRTKPLSDTQTSYTVSPEEKKKIVNFLLNQNKKKEYGGELESFKDGGGKKGTEQNPFELPEITITPDTKLQAQMAETYKYMPEDVKQAIAYDMENPDMLTESSEEQSYLSRGFDAVTHPFTALNELHNRKGLQSNWLALNQDRSGPNFLDWALYGAAAARFLPQAAKELPKYLSSSLPGMSKIPGATLGNALASEGIANTLLRESGYSGDEDPSTVREWEKYNEGSQDLSTTIANTGVNLLDVGLTAVGDFKPFISETAKELKRNYKTVKDAFTPNLTMNNVFWKIDQLKAKNPTSFIDAKMPFEELKKQKLEFWNTPEGNRRVQKYIDETIAPYNPAYTVDDYIKEMSEIEYVNPIEVLEQRNLKEIREQILREKYEKITATNKLLVDMQDKINMMQQNRRTSVSFDGKTNILKTNAIIPEEERNMIDEFTRLKNEYKNEMDDFNDLKYLHNTDEYYPENNASYWGRNVDGKTPVGGGPIIHVGEDYSLPSNLKNSLWHEFSHAQSLYPLDKISRGLPKNTGVNFRLRTNLDFEDFALNRLKLKEYYRNVDSYGKGNYVSPDYVFPSEKQVLEWENAMPPWIDKSQLDLAKMYENAVPLSEGILGKIRYHDPKAYTASQFSYFFHNDEANAFLNELIPELMHQGYMTKLGDKIEPNMLKELFENYRNSGKTKMTEAIRLLDFIKPTQRSLKALAEELNNLQVLLIGAGGASGLKAAGAFDNTETTIEQQKFGGNISNLQKFTR